ncbi:MAG: carboxypeptidase-like regulatory domain-containing protein [Thermoanaerobaculia bacterium]
MLTAALVATVVFSAVPSYAAGRRRAVSHPTFLNQVTSPKISGTVVDDVTGQPVIFATVHVGDRIDTTDSAGKYQVRNVVGVGGKITIEASRTGYTTKSAQVTTGGEHVVDLRMKPLPTVHVKKTDNTIVELDADSVEFGYPILFSGYTTAPFEEFCKPNGTAITVNRAEIRRVNGPATKSVQSACCGTNEVEKVNVELKTGEVTDLYFVDTCNNGSISSIDLIGRNHTTGKVEYTAFSAISEIVFP